MVGEGGGFRIWILQYFRDRTFLIEVLSKSRLFSLQWGVANAHAHLGDGYHKVKTLSLILGNLKF